MLPRSQRDILITGCARTGTSLLTLLMQGFEELKVYAEAEQSPLTFTGDTSGQRVVIKCPQGRKSIDADFGEPALAGDPARCFLQYHLDTYDVLICVRDARDILVSQHARYPGKYYVSPERCRAVLERDIAALAHPHVLLVPYEQLVTVPDTTMQNIARHIQADYDYSYTGHFYEGLTATTEMTVALNGIRPIDTQSVGGWRLPRHAARMRAVLPYYERYIAPLMQQLGY